MTNEDLIIGLVRIKDEKGDIEMAHVHADNLLLKFIDDTRVSKAFEDIEKWYA